MLVRLHWNDVMKDLMTDTMTNDTTSCGCYPAVDVVEKENEIVFAAELPGVKKEDISLKVENGWLLISGERKPTEVENVTKIWQKEIAYNRFERSLKLPETVNVNGVDASLSNGILAITFPKMEQVKPRSIEIN